MTAYGWNICGCIIYSSVKRCFITCVSGFSEPMLVAPSLTTSVSWVMVLAEDWAAWASFSWLDAAPATSSLVSSTSALAVFKMLSLRDGTHCVTICSRVTQSRTSNMKGCCCFSNRKAIFHLHLLCEKHLKIEYFWQTAPNWKIELWCKNNWNIKIDFLWAQTESYSPFSTSSIVILLMIRSFHLNTCLGQSHCTCGLQKTLHFQGWEFQLRRTWWWCPGQRWYQKQRWLLWYRPACLCSPPAVLTEPRTPGTSQR